ESFYMSNMTPQLPDFNRGMWKDLEGMVRQWAVRFGEVTVVTGPVLEKSAAEYSSIGKNNVSVPEFFYKALLAQNEGSYISIGFILPNKKCTGTVFDYAVSVDEVERRTELDFFSRLPDSVEEFVESRTDYSLWK
ncbi:MAG: DNA/RNA non-specific endonuclease, partial [Treponema sp.]|nr:DNA/RNA non-specific endonuclease [Treponema sp.]